MASWTGRLSVTYTPFLIYSFALKLSEGTWAIPAMNCIKLISEHLGSLGTGQWLCFWGLLLAEATNDSVGTTPQTQLLAK